MQPLPRVPPGLKQLEAVYGGEGFELVSVNEDDDAAVGQRFAAQNGMNWTQRSDPGHQLMRQYGASALPTYTLIGKDGTVVQQYVGHDLYNPAVSPIGPDIKKSLNREGVLKIPPHIVSRAFPKLTFPQPIIRRT